MKIEVNGFVLLPFLVFLVLKALAMRNRHCRR